MFDCVMGSRNLESERILQDCTRHSHWQKHAIIHSM